MKSRLGNSPIKAGYASPFKFSNGPGDISIEKMGLVGVDFDTGAMSPARRTKKKK